MALLFPTRRGALLHLLIVLALCGRAAPCSAGGGPENVLLVVNQNSVDSLTVANYYVRLRDIPPQNVLYLDWRTEASQINGKAFREKLLDPIIAAIDGRRLGAQIDYVVYSCDLPTRVNFQDLFPDRKFAKGMRPIASITGATYLWQHVMQQSETLLGMNANWYVPDATNKNLSTCAALADAPSRGFRTRYGLLPGGKRAEDPKQGQHYFLSTMLGVTEEFGNTVEEVAQCLIRAAAADGTHPEGAFYFLHSEDVRSKTRHACFESVAAALRRQGASAVVKQGKLPFNASDVVGLMTGFPKAHIEEAKMTVAPGALCEHLTSFGGIFDRDLGQSNLAGFIRAGAAGSSGTVTEPLALQAKFPLPTVHLHYYRGCSLAEAFYQSVAAPYQLLIVGDPLCQPWATPPECRALGLVDDKLVKGELQITPRLSDGATQCEMYVDGALQRVYPPGVPVTLDSTKLKDGRHELRLVAVGAQPIETRGRLIAGINVDNRLGGPITLSSSPAKRVAAGQTLTVTAADGAHGLFVIRQNSRTIGQAKGDVATLDIDAQTLGRGPVRLEAIEPISGERSPPLWEWVD